MNKIVIDIYGADAGPLPIIQGTVRALQQDMDFFPVLVGDQEQIDAQFHAAGIAEDRYEILHTQDYIHSDEPAAAIFRGRNESSMAMAYERLKADESCCALLSPGSTGALLVGSISRLGLQPGMKFPALASALPCNGEKLLCLVDCGANMSCSAKDLTDFARMGNVFCQCFCDVEHPRVGLMSVGREKGKGTELVQQAYDAIAALDLNFVGNLEGSDMVSGYADVVVTDGFSGNLLLKNTEASGKAALAAIEALGLDSDIMSTIRAALIQKFDFNSRGAATFLGTKKTVVKMHGCANEDTVIASIDQILRLHNACFAQRIADEMK